MKFIFVLLLSTFSQLINAQAVTRAECISRCYGGSVSCVDFRSGNSVKETTEPYKEMIQNIKNNISGDYLKSKCKMITTVGADRISFSGDSCLISQKISFWNYLYETKLPSEFSGQFIKVGSNEFQINFNGKNYPIFSYGLDTSLYSSGPVEFVTNYKNSAGIDSVLWYSDNFCFTATID